MSETPAEKLERKQSESTGRAPGPSRTKPTKPQDRKPKKVKPKKTEDGMVQVEIEGVSVKIDPEGAKDWRFIEAQGALQSGLGEPQDMFITAAIMIPERSDRNKLSAHVADPETGRVDPKEYFEFFQKFMEAVDLGN